MPKIKAGINGMGRIGQNLARAIVTDYADAIEIAAVNDLVDIEVLQESLSRDSTYGGFPVETSIIHGSKLKLGANEIDVYSQKDASNIPWKESGVEIVFECSGFYLTKEKARGHLTAGAKKVIMSAPPKDDTPVYVIGVNDRELKGLETVISNASCTTNCLAPVVKALDDAFGVIHGFMSTTHAATNNQKVLDAFGSERARAVLNNIIPTTTGAAKAIGKVIPRLDGKMNGGSLRVPVSVGSVVEAVVLVEGEYEAAEISEALQKASEEMNTRSPLGTILYIGKKYQVSADAVGSTWSSMVLEPNIMVIPGRGNTLVRITSFYDNEMGYAHRLAELGILSISAGT